MARNINSKSHSTTLRDDFMLLRDFLISSIPKTITKGKNNVKQ